MVDEVLYEYQVIDVFHVAKYTSLTEDEKAHSSITSTARISQKLNEYAALGWRVVQTMNISDTHNKIIVERVKRPTVLAPEQEV